MCMHDVFIVVVVFCLFFVVQSSSTVLKELKRIPELPGESPYLPGDRRIIHSDEPILLTAINPLSNGGNEPDEELYPLSPAGGPAAGSVFPAEQLGPGSNSPDTPVATSYSQSGGAPAVSVKVSNLAATWKEKESKETKEVDLMDSAVLKNVSFEVSQVGSCRLDLSFPWTLISCLCCCH